MMKLLFVLLTLGIGFYASDSSAQLFRLRTTDYGPLVGAARTQWDAALVEIENDVNKEFPSTEDPKRLMKGMANSSVMAGKGIGSDYASNMDVLLVGAGVGVGADLEKDKNTESDLSGAGIQGGIIVGTNLGWMDTQKILGLDTNKLNLYVNYLGYNLDRKMGDGDKDSIKAKLNSFGVHASYDWIKGSGSKLFGWGGVKIHTGYEYNTTKLTFKSTIKETVSEDVGGGNTVSGTINGRPAASIDVATQSIPVEISTNVQLLYVLSLYTGLGVDFNFGKAKGDGALNADETDLTYNGTPGAGPSVQAEANIDSSSNVDSILTRGFVGLQINLPYIRIFGQVDKAFGNDLIGGTAGVRLVF